MSEQQGASRGGLDEAQAQLTPIARQLASRLHAIGAYLPTAEAVLIVAEELSAAYVEGLGVERGAALDESDRAALTQTVADSFIHPGS